MVRSFLVSIVLFLSYQLSAQNQAVTVLDELVSVEFNGASIPAVLRQIDRLSAVNFSYNSSLIPRDVKISETYSETSVRTILTEVLSKVNLYFREVNGTVIILKQQFSERKIKGRVVMLGSDSPLAYANVFIERSMLGVYTDLNGEFEITDIPNIGFNLVVSYLGYKSKKIPFDGKKDLSSSTYVVELEVDPKVLESIQVIGKARKKRVTRDERKLRKRFEVDFLGSSDNAKKCRIVNPEVLNFEVIDSLDNYVVTADDILFIENRALGFRIEYLLEEFKYENGLKLNIGNARFKELETKSRRVYSRWESAREVAYNGSPQHFLNAAISNSLEEEGFELNIVQYDSITYGFTTPLNPPPIEEILTVTKTSDEYIYKLHANHDVEVTYKGEFEDAKYKKIYRSTSKGGNYKYTDKKVRTSIALTNIQSLYSYQDFGVDATEVELFQKSIIFFINPDTQISYPGRFKSPRDVLFAGWWVWGSLSDWLPLNYKPD